MKAALYRTTGAARDVLEIADVDEPVPGPGEVRVAMHCSGINPTDVKSRDGYLGRPMSFKHQVPGHDGAGVIAAVGAGVDPARVGQRVWLFHAALGSPIGTAAESTVVAEGQAVALPDSVDNPQAAGLGIPFMTAHRSLFADGPIHGQTILVAGGAGAVGNAAIQLAARAGARVIATASDDAKAELARSAGAELVVDYKRPDAGELIRGHAPDGVDRFIEVALATNLELDLAVAAHGATIATYATEPTPVELPVPPLILGDLKLMFMLIYTTPEPALREALDYISSALADGALRPLPTVRFPLAEIAAAHEHVEAGVTGKVVLDIA